MDIQIRYRTAYRFQEVVSFSPHAFRLFPRLDHLHCVTACEFRTNAGASTRFRRDLFDNEVAFVFYPEAASELLAELDLGLKIEQRNPFDFLLDPHAVEFPFSYTPQELRVLRAYLESDASSSPLPFWKAPEKTTPTLDVFTDLNRAIHQEIAYKRREDGPPQRPEETIELRCGACRDFAMLMMATVRSLGCAARLVSGYLLELEQAEQRAENAFHAWLEIYLPGAGWTGFDPTNGILADHHHIAAAVGLTDADVTPVLGSFFHPDAKVLQPEMTASLKIIRTSS